MRVLNWMVGRIEGTAQGEEHAFGISPHYEDIDWSGLDFSREQFEQVISVDDAAWRDELALHDELFTSCARLAAGFPETKGRDWGADSRHDHVSIHSLESRLRAVPRSATPAFGILPIPRRRHHSVCSNKKDSASCTAADYCHFANNR